MDLNTLSTTIPSVKHHVLLNKPTLEAAESWLSSWLIAEVASKGKLTYLPEYAVYCVPQETVPAL